MASWAEIPAHTKADEDLWFMILTPSVIAPAALPGRTAHVHTRKSADTLVSSPGQSYTHQISFESLEELPSGS